MNRRTHLQRPDPVARSVDPVVARLAAPLSLEAMRSTDVLHLQSAARRSMDVGAAGDTHEVEAYAVAREIMNSTAPAETQRAAEDEDELQMKRVQRETEKEQLQMKRVQRETEGAESEDEELQLKRIDREAEEDELQLK